MRSADARGTAGSGGTGPRPLIVSRRPSMIDELVRLAATAGLEPDVRPDLGSAGAAWRSAPIVLVDDAAVATGSGARALPARDGVVLVTDDLDSGEVWRHGVEVGADHVVVLPDAAPWLLEQLTAGRDGRAEPGRVLAVVGGRGGAGASTLAAGLAVTAVGRGLRTLLVDLDPLGGGIDLAVGGEDSRGLRWPDLTRARGRLNAAALRDALPTVGDLPVLAWDRESDTEVPFDAARAVLDAAVLASDLVVVDLPRAAGDASSFACGLAEELLLVSPAEVRAVVAAERVLRGYRSTAARVAAVVRLPAPSDLSARDVCTALDVPLAAELRSDPALAAELDRGESPVRRSRSPLAVACARLLDRTGDASASPAAAG